MNIQYGKYKYDLELCVNNVDNKYFNSSLGNHITGYKCRNSNVVVCVCVCPDYCPSVQNSITLNTSCHKDCHKKS